MDQRGVDPAEIVVAWEAVDELLAPVPDGDTKHVLRLVAAGLSSGEIADQLGLDEEEIEALAARGRIRLLTAALGQEPSGEGSPRSPTQAD